MNKELDKRAEIIGERLNQKQTSKSQESLKGRPSITMYLPKNLYQELNTKFLELQLEGNREGVKLEKNRDFYPKVIRAGLHSLTDQDVLES